MKRNYIALWSILAVAFVLFFALSTCDDISIGGWHPKKSELSSVFTRQSDTISVPDSDSSGSTDRQDKQRLVQTHLGATPLNILFIGDSMLEGLSPRLGAYCATSGHNVNAVIWYGATTEQYGESKLLSDYIRTLHPDFIFISLGGNELFVNDVAAKRDKYIKSIVAELGDIPYLWIGPPNWKPDTGINDLIKSNVPEGCFFLSDGLEFQRKKDGAHPTQESAIVWMDTILHWMPDHGKYVLDLNAPEADTKRPRFYIHQPGALTERPK